MLANHSTVGRGKADLLISNWPSNKEHLLYSRVCPGVKTAQKEVGTPKCCEKNKLTKQHVEGKQADMLMVEQTVGFYTTWIAFGEPPRNLRTISFPLMDTLLDFKTL